MTMGVGYLGGPSAALLDATRALIDGADDVFFATAYVRESGVGLLEGELRGLRARGGRARLLTTYDFGLTEPRALERLEDAGAQVRVVSYPDRAFHPKTTLASAKGAPTVLVGSANLTSAALLRNVESGVRLDGPAGRSVFADAHAHLQEIWSSDARAFVRGTRIERAHEPVRRVVVVEPAAVAQAAEAVASLPAATTVRQAVRQEIEQLCAPGTEIRTAGKGAVNRVLAVDPARGIRVETTSGAGWVDWWMFEAVIDAVCLSPSKRMPLNAPAGSGVRDLTRWLRVHRSSFVVAALAQTRWFEVRTRPRVELAWVGGALD